MFKLKVQSKKILISIMAAIMLVSFGLFASTMTKDARAEVVYNGQATTVSSFKMLDGASIAYPSTESDGTTTGSGGLRFSGLISKEDFETLKKDVKEGNLNDVTFGTIFLPESLAQDNNYDITLETPKVEDVPQNVSWYSFTQGEVEYYRFNAVMRKIPASAYDQKLIARCYMKLSGTAVGATDDAPVVVYTSNVMRSVVDVAQNTLTFYEFDGTENGAANKDYIEDLLLNARYRIMEGNVSASNAEAETFKFAEYFEVVGGYAANSLGFVRQNAGKPVTLRLKDEFTADYSIENVEVIENYYSTLEAGYLGDHVFTTAEKVDGSEWTFTMPQDNVTLNVTLYKKDETYIDVMSDYDEATNVVMYLSSDKDIGVNYAVFRADNDQQLAERTCDVLFMGTGESVGYKSDVAPSAPGTYVAVINFLGDDYSKPSYKLVNFLVNAREITPDASLGGNYAVANGKTVSLNITLDNLYNATVKANESKILNDGMTVTKDEANNRVVISGIKQDWGSNAAYLMFGTYISTINLESFSIGTYYDGDGSYMKQKGFMISATQQGGWASENEFGYVQANRIFVHELDNPNSTNVENETLYARYEGYDRLYGFGMSANGNVSNLYVYPGLELNYYTEKAATVAAAGFNSQSLQIPITVDRPDVVNGGEITMTSVAELGVSAYAIGVRSEQTVTYIPFTEYPSTVGDNYGEPTLTVPETEGQYLVAINYAETVGHGGVGFCFVAYASGETTTSIELVWDELDAETNTVRRPRTGEPQDIPYNVVDKFGRPVVSATAMSTIEYYAYDEATSGYTTLLDGAPTELGTYKVVIDYAGNELFLASRLEFTLEIYHFNQHDTYLTEVKVDGYELTEGETIKRDLESYNPWYAFRIWHTNEGERPSEIVNRNYTVTYYNTNGLEDPIVFQYMYDEDQNLIRPAVNRPENAGTYEVTITLMETWEYYSCTFMFYAELIGGMENTEIAINLEGNDVEEGSVQTLKYEDLYNAETEKAEFDLTAKVLNSSGTEISGAEILVFYTGINETSYAQSNDKPTNPGEYRVFAKYNGNFELFYGADEFEFTLVIDTLPTEIKDVTFNGQAVSEDETIDITKDDAFSLTYNLYDFKNAIVTEQILTVRYYDFDETTQSYTLETSYKDMTSGTYKVVISYDGNNYYQASTFAFYVNVDRPDTHIEVEGAVETTLDLFYTGSPIDLTAISAVYTGVNKVEGAVIDITYYDLNDEAISAPTDMGTYKAVLTYAGDDTHNASTLTLTVNIVKNNTEIKVTYDGVEVTQDQLVNKDYKGSAYELISSVLVNGALSDSLTANVKYYLGTEADGVYTYEEVAGEPVDVGRYKIVLTVDGDETRNGAEFIFYVNIEKINTTLEVDFVYNETTLDVANGDTVAVLANDIADGYEIVSTVSNGGVATYEIYDANNELVTPDPTTEGNYRVEVLYAGDENYNASRLTFRLNISRSEATIEITSDQDVTDSITRIYDGEMQNVTAVVKGLNGVILTETPTITYYDGETALATAPVNAGSYKVTVAFDGNDSYSALSKDFVFTVEQAVSNIVVVVDEVVFDGETQTITRYKDGTPKAVTAKIVANNTVITDAELTYTYYKDSVSLDGAPSDVGTYTVTIAYAGTENYASATLNIIMIIKEAPASSGNGGESGGDTTALPLSDIIDLSGSLNVAEGSDGKFVITNTSYDDETRIRFSEGFANEVTVKMTFESCADSLSLKYKIKADGTFVWVDLGVSVSNNVLTYTGSDIGGFQIHGLGESVLTKIEIIDGSNTYVYSADGTGSGSGGETTPTLPDGVSSATVDGSVLTITFEPTLTYQMASGWQSNDVTLPVLISLVNATNAHFDSTTTGGAWVVSFSDSASGVFSGTYDEADLSDGLDLALNNGSLTQFDTLQVYSDQSRTVTINSIAITYASADDANNAKNALTGASGVSAVAEGSSNSSVAGIDTVSVNGTAVTLVLNKQAIVDANVAQGLNNVAVSDEGVNFTFQHNFTAENFWLPIVVDKTNLVSLDLTGKAPDNNYCDILWNNSQGFSNTEMATVSVIPSNVYDDGSTVHFTFRGNSGTVTKVSNVITINYATEEAAESAAIGYGYVETIENPKTLTEVEITSDTLVDDAIIYRNYNGEQQPAVTAIVKDASGNEVTGATYTVTYEGLDLTEYAKSTTAPTDKGVYRVVVSYAGDDSYTNSGFTAIMEIVVAEPQDVIIVVDGEVGGVVTKAYNGMAQTVTASLMDTKGRPVSGDIQIAYVGDHTNVGEYQVTLTFNANEYYNAASKTITLKIEKADTTVTATLNGANVNNGETKELTSAEGLDYTLIGSVSPVEAGNVTITYNDSEIKPTTAGNYAVKVTFAGNDNYNASELQFVLKIADKTVTNIEITNDEVTENVITRTYDGEAQSITAVVKANGNTISENPTITYNGSETAPVNVGEYQVVISYAGDDSFVASEMTVTLVIEKADTTVTATLNDIAVNDGDTKELSSADGLNYTVVGLVAPAEAGTTTTTYKQGETTIEKPTTAGTYTVTIAFAGNDNYNASELQFVLKIADKTVTNIEITNDEVTENVITRTYDGEAQSITAVVKANGNTISENPTITYNGSETAPVNVGEYQVVISYAGDDSFVASSLTVTLVIKEIETSIGGVFYYGTEDENGNENVANIENGATYYTQTAIRNYEVRATATPENVGELSVQYYDKDGNALTGEDNKPVYGVAGTFRVDVTYTATEYGYKSSSVTFTLVVEKSSTTVFVVNPDMTEGQTEHTVYVDNLPFNFEYTVFDGRQDVIRAWSNETLPEGISITYNGGTDVPTAVGVYEVEVAFAGNENFKAATKTFTLNVINKTATTIEITSDGLVDNVITRTYNGEAHAITAIVKAGEVTISENPTIVYTGDGEPSTSAPIYPGTYSVTISYAGDETHAAAEKTITLVINKADVLVTATLNDIAVNDGETKTLTSADGLNYTVVGSVTPAEAGMTTTTYKQGETTIEKPTAAGTYTVTIAFAENTLYNENSITFTLVIAEKIETAITVTSDTVENDVITKTYNGEAHAITAVVKETSNNTTISENPTITYNGSETAPVNAGSYEVTISYAGNDSYKAVEKTVTLVIEKADTVVGATINGGDYNNQAVVNGETYTLTEKQAESYTISGTVNPVAAGGATVAYSGGAVPTTEGSYTVTVSYEGNDNYNAATSLTFTLEITKPTEREIVVTSDTVVDDGVVRTFDGENQIITAEVQENGVKVGTPSIIYEGKSGTTYAASATAPVNVGSYEVTISFTADDVTIEKIITLTIGKANAEISIIDEISNNTITRTANGSAQVVNAVVLSNGNVVQGANIGIDYSGSSTAPSAAGEYTVTLTYAGDGNYNVAATVTVTLVINEASSGGSSEQRATVSGTTVTVNVTLDELYNANVAANTSSTTGATVEKDEANNRVVVTATKDEWNNGDAAYLMFGIPVNTADLSSLGTNMATISGWGQQKHWVTGTSTNEGWSDSIDLNSAVTSDKFDGLATLTGRGMKAGNGTAVAITPGLTLIYSSESAAQAAAAAFNANYPLGSGGGSSETTDTTTTIELTSGDVVENGVITRTFDGDAQSITATVNQGGTQVAPTSITYEGIGDTVYTASQTAPTDIGTYKVTVEYADASAQTVKAAERTLRLSLYSATAETYAADGTFVKIYYLNIVEAAKTATTIVLNEENVSGDVVSKLYDGNRQSVSATVNANGTEVSGAEIVTVYTGVNGTNYAKTTVAPSAMGEYVVTISYLGNETYAPSVKNVTLKIVETLYEPSYTTHIWNALEKGYKTFYENADVKDGISRKDYGDYYIDGNFAANKANGEWYPSLDFTTNGQVWSDLYFGSANGTAAYIDFVETYSVSKLYLTYNIRSVSGLKVQINETDMVYALSDTTGEYKGNSDGGGVYTITIPFATPIALDKLVFTADNGGDFAMFEFGFEYISNGTATSIQVSSDEVVNNAISRVQDGETQIVTANVLAGGKVIANTTGNEVTVTYEGINGTTYAASETAPINVGTYKVTISYAGDDQNGYLGSTLELTMSIVTAGSGGVYTLAYANTTFATGDNDSAMTTAVNNEIDRVKQFTFSDLTYSASVPAREMTEIGFNISETFDAAYRNSPFTVEINGYFTTPSGSVKVVPAFYKQDSSPNWAVRFNPSETGNYTFYLKDEKFGTVSATGAFTVTSANANNRGKIKVVEDDYVDADGKVIALRGANMTSGYSVEEYQTAAPILNSNGVNYIRFWAWDWDAVYSLENGSVSGWEETAVVKENTMAAGVGQYKLSAASNIDQVMQAMEDNNVYVMFTLFNIWDFQGGHWVGNVYNSNNGGQCSYSSGSDGNGQTDFWSSSWAIKYQAQLVRYISARYGSYTSFAMMEYWNEADNKVLPNGLSQDSLNRVATWHQTMHNVFEENDIYGTSESTSFAWTDHAGRNEQIWENMTFLDVVKRHRYVHEDYTQDWLNNINKINDGRAFVMSEFGPSNIDDSAYSFANYKENLAVEGLWAPIFFGNAASTNMYWFNGDKWYDNSGDYAGYIGMYKAQSDFMADVEGLLAGAPNYNDTAYPGLRLGSYSDNDSAMLYASCGSDTAWGNQEMQIWSMDNGTYNVTVLNPRTGETTTSQVVVTDNILRLNTGDFTRCVAIKAVKA